MTAKANKTAPKVPEAQIDYTTEYDVFKRKRGNRDVIEAHVRHLMEKMMKKDLLIPILVNQDFEVIDGQHRLEARKRLGLPVPYYWTDGLDLEDVQKLNSGNRAWNNTDYAKSFVEQGNENYKIYLWFRDHYDVSHRPAVTLLSGRPATGGSIKEIFQSGRFEVRSLKDAQHKMEMLREIGKYFTRWNDDGFISAFMTVLGREGFDFKQFMHKLSQNPQLAYPCVNLDGYLRMIEELYNYRSVHKVPLRFGKELKPKAKVDAKRNTGTNKAGARAIDKQQAATRAAA